MLARRTVGRGKKAGALFIVDEIQAGFGRTGKMWSLEHYDVEPDMVVWGKGVAGELPLTGVTVQAEYQSKLEVGSQLATFPGNALACAVAAKGSSPVKVLEGNRKVIPGTRRPDGK